MTYPDQQYPGYPPAPAQPAPGYPQQPAPYPNQGYPQQAPPQAPYPNQGYPQQAPPQAPYPNQGYPQQAPPQAPPPQTGLADYLDQPAMGGQSLQFNATGDSWTGRVARDLVDGPGDFPVQTERDGVTPKKFRDGRLMVRMVVPLIVRPDERHPDGHATLSVQGQAAEALKQAMAAVGAGHLKGIPEKDSVITVTWISSIPPKTQGFSPTKIYQYIYQRPPGAAQADAAAQAASGQQHGQAPLAPAPQTMEQVRQLVPQGPGAPANFANPQGHYEAPQVPAQAAQQYAAVQGQIPQWPAPGAPLSVPPQPAPPGENPYSAPQPPYQGIPPQPAAPVGQPPAAPVGQQPYQGIPPQPAAPVGQPPAAPVGQQPVPGMAGPGQQVAYATQQGTQAAQAARPQITPENQAIINELLGGQAPPQ